MKFILLACTILLITGTSQAANKVWVNLAGGDWSVTNNWSPAGPPDGSDNVFITNNGTYTVTILTNAATVANLTLGGSSGIQTLINGNVNDLTMTNFGQVRSTGVLTVTNGGLQGALSIASGGQLNFAGAATKFLYNLALTNHGTVNWSDGFLYVGGNNTMTTYITNSGLWQMTSNNTMSYGGGSIPIFYNSGTVSKIAGAGNTSFSTVNFINLPSGVVNVTAGTLLIYPGGTNYIAGTYNITSPGAINIFGGSCADAGGVINGNGTFACNNGNFYLRTNTIPGLQIGSGEIYVNTNTFQHAGVITNLTIDGADLHGPNQVGGTLTFNSGSLLDEITVQPSGQLVFATGGAKLLYGLNLINQGTVAWNAGSLNIGGTPGTVVSNGGAWLMNGDDTTSYGGGNTPYFTNSGTIHKTAGTGNSTFSGFYVINQPGGLIQVDSGTINFYIQGGYTNLAGTMRLNGGQFQGAYGIILNGGTLDGSGNFGPNALVGGTVSPGQNGPGTIGFPSGLNFGSNATLVVNGTSTSQYDQLFVTGAVVLANCTLQVSSLPAVPIGTTFTIINNDGADAVSGTFNNLPENSLINVSGQFFKIHYAGGSGNDVTLVRTTGGSGPQLTAGSGSYTNHTFHLTGNGNSSVIFTVQASTNFIQWTNIGTATSDLSGNLLFIDTNAPQFRYRFYRTTN